MTTEAATDSGFELRILDPKTVRLFRHGGVLRMTLGEERSYLRVIVTRAFPLSDPNCYYGFLDGAGKDIGIVSDPTQLAPDVRSLCEEELEKRYFVPVVTHVQKVKEEYGTTVWEVETDRGPKKYWVRHLRDNLAELSSERVIITDVDGNRFEIPNIHRLDPISLGLLLRNM
jgi:hypothetical protein